MRPTLLDSSFLIALEREMESGCSGSAMAWLRQARGRGERGLLVSCVTVAEFLEGFSDEVHGLAFITQYVLQPLGYGHAKKCAALQRKARRAGRRFGENDAWQLAVAECADASIVGCDRAAFSHLGKRYEQFDSLPVRTKLMEPSS